MAGMLAPVVAGLAAGIGFVVIFSLLYYSAPVAVHNTGLEPQILQEQAIRTAESEIAKNRWYFKYPEGSPLFVLDFKDTNYYPVSDFVQLQDGRKLPLVFLYSNGTITDVNGQISDTLEICKREKGFGYCEFIDSLRGEQSGARGSGNLAYFVGLDWWSYTHLFVIDAIDGRLLSSTIYLRPILYQEDVERDLEMLGKPKITREQALSIVEDDLRKRHPDFDKIAMILYDNEERMITMDEFWSRNLDLPLMYIHSSGTIIFVVNGTQAEMGYYCDSARYPYCGFQPPFNLDSKGRLVYGIDILWNTGSAIYAVDALNGKIVDSSYLRAEARR
jgi:hypothetical protein